MKIDVYETSGELRAVSVLGSLTARPGGLIYVESNIFVIIDDRVRATLPGVELLGVGRRVFANPHRGVGRQRFFLFFEFFDWDFLPK